MKMLVYLARFYLHISAPSWGNYHTLPSNGTLWIHLYLQWSDVYGVYSKTAVDFYMIFSQNIDNPYIYVYHMPSLSHIGQDMLK